MALIMFFQISSHLTLFSHWSAVVFSVWSTEKMWTVLYADQCPYGHLGIFWALYLKGHIGKLECGRGRAKVIQPPHREKPSSAMLLTSTHTASHYTLPPLTEELGESREIYFLTHESLIAWPLTLASLMLFPERSQVEMTDLWRPSLPASSG